MIAANFTGGEAEELRRAMGFKRSQARMREIEARLRAGMTQNGISPKAQEEIILSITSFALYGFPESHAASFALIAYASAYLKCHYLAAFTAASAQQSTDGILFSRHHRQRCAAPRPETAAGRCDEVRVEVHVGNSTQYPVLSTQSTSRQSSAFNPQQYPCHSDPRANARGGRISVVLATRSSGRMPALKQSDENLTTPFAWACATSADCAKKQAKPWSANALRTPFTSIHDLTRRVPELRKDELTTLAEIGALNCVG